MEKSEPKQYGAFQLLEEELDADPFMQFGRWYDAASSAGLVHPDAFALATVSGDGKPSARMLLLKGFDQNGFVFFTNSESRKGEDLRGNTNAAICFWWDKLERSVRIEGKVHAVSREEADIYFATRPRGSRLGAWASQQSRVIESREYLDKLYHKIELDYADMDIPRPDYWNGYRLAPSSIEFWQGRPNRLHDRLRYRKHRDGRWIIERLAP